MRAPAKINLDLRILRRRDDGFHEISTLICPLDLADEVEVEVEVGGDPGIALHCDEASLPAGPENLAWRAADAFLAKAGLAGAAVRIRLQKRIPHGAGLGGGSSDAAAVLRALDARHPGAVTGEALAEIAAGIGSDVPVFLRGTACRCTGRGEICAPEPVPRLPVLLLKPAFGVPTPFAYKAWRESRELPGLPYAEQRLGPEGLALANDLERPVFEKYPILGLTKRWLLARPGVRAALMSGSGATVFAVLEKPGAGEIIAAAKAEFGETLWAWEGWTA